MSGSATGKRRLESILRWIARVWSVVSVGFVLCILVGELVYPHAAPPSSVREMVGLLLFPLGVCVGLVLAWRWEAVGGAIALGSLALFYLVLFLSDGRFPRGPYFALVAAPGLLFLVAWAIGTRRKDGVTNALSRQE